MVILPLRATRSQPPPPGLTPGRAEGRERKREALLKLAKALGCRDNALRRDENGDWRISGSKGCVYAVPGLHLPRRRPPRRRAPREGAGSGTLDERGVGEGFRCSSLVCGTSRQWTAVKAAMKGFTSLTNDGDDEGALFAGRLTVQAKRGAETDPRRYCGVAKKRELGEEELARLRAFALETRFKPKLLASNDVDGEQEPLGRPRWKATRGRDGVSSMKRNTPQRKHHRRASQSPDPHAAWAYRR